MNTIAFRADKTAYYEKNKEKIKAASKERYKRCNNSIMKQHNEYRKRYRLDNSIGYELFNATLF